MGKYRFKTEPYEHQREALRRGWDKEYFAYLMEMGTGKTKVLLDNACILYERGMIDGLVIFAPKGVYQNWVREIDIHVPDPIRKQMQICFWTSNPNKTFTAKTEKVLGSRFPVLIMNIEAMVSTKAETLAGVFLNMRECLMVVDESTKIKNIKAKRTKKIRDLGLDAKYRRILTGSPVVNNPMDLYGQSEFLKPRLIANSEPGFRNQYCVTREMKVEGRDKKTGGRRTFKIPTIVGSKNIDRLQDKLAMWSFRARKDECLDLPDKVYTVVEVEMTPEQKKIYDELLNVAYYQFEDDTEVSAQVIIQQLLRLHQVVCGHVKDDDGNLRELKNNRFDALMQVLEETEGKVIIWANYVHDIEVIMTLIQKAYGAGVAVPYYGSVSLPDRDYAVQAIQNGAARFLVGNTQTAGHGLTLTACNTHIYFSNNYNLELRVQSEDRSHRIGQKHNVTYVDLVTKGTVDEKILYALRNKIDLAAAIQQDGPQSWVV